MSRTVLMLSRSASHQSLGGPVWTIQALLRAHARAPVPGLTLAGVFCDGVADRWRAFDGREARSGRGSGLLPPSVFYVGQAVLSMPRLLLHLDSAARSRPGPIVLDCHDFVSTYLCRCRFGRRYPLLLTIHAKGSGVREMLLDHRALRRTPVEWLARHIETTAVRWADVVVFPSRGAQALFSGEYPGALGRKDVRVIYTGIDTEELRVVPHDESVLRRYQVPSERTLVMSVAAMVRDKGLDTLVEALAALPREFGSRIICLIVAREGPLKEELERAIARYSLQEQIRLLGFLPRQDLVQLLRQASLFVLPSRVAVFDLVLLEAAALGTPVVTTAVGGNLEMFDRKSAALVPPDDPVALASAIVEALEDRALAKQRAEHAVLRVEHDFSVEAMWRSYIALYEKFAAAAIAS